MKDIYNIRLINIKIGATFFGLIFFIITFLLFFNYTIFKDTIYSSHEEYSKSLAGSVKLSVLNHFENSQRPIDNLLNKLIQNDSNILFIKILDEDGHDIGLVQNGDFEEFFKAKITDFSSIMIASQNNLSEKNLEHLFRDDLYTTVVTTFRYANSVHQSGMVIVGLSNELTDSRLNRNLLLSLVIGIFTSLLSLSLAVYSSQKLSRPIHKMALMFKGVLEYAPINIIIRKRNGEIIDTSKYHTDAFNENFKSSILKKSYESQWKHAFSEIDNELVGEKDLYRKNFHFMKNDNEEESFITISFKLKDKDKKEELFCTLAINTSEENQYQKDLVLKSYEAKKASDAKTSFLATMSHEIRTPLTSIIGFLGLLEESVLSDKQEKYTKTALGASENLLALINDILDYSKIESKDFKLEYGAVSLIDLSQEIASIFEHQMKEKSLDFIIEISPEVKSFIEADNVRFRQILINLVGNAVKFTSKGCISLNIQLLANEGLFQRLRFNIVDTGIGIKEDQLSNIFEQFTQADNSISRMYGGTGLGLSITKKLINMMGGVIHVSSEYGKGSHFYFDLEFKTLNNSEVAQSHTNKVHLEKIDYSSKYVLVVDDDESNRQLISLYLARFGLKLDVCDNGNDAIKMVNDNRYDLVLLDIQMPGMDGVETLLEIREHERLNNLVSTKIFAFTANVFKEQLDEYRAHGFNGHLLKPFKKDDLIEFITKNLS